MTGAPVGIIAGEGPLPVLAAQALQEDGRRVVVCGLTSSPAEQLREIADDLRTITPDQFGIVPEYFLERGVEELLMVGNVDKTQLYDPDRREGADEAVQSLLSSLPAKGDENLIKAAARLLQVKGLTVIGVDEVLSDRFTPEGHLAGPPLSEADRGTLRVLETLAGNLADEEVGQTVSGHQQSVVAVEASEGTDAMIRRTGEIAGAGCVVLKRARSDQDPRFDVPVVGRRTVGELAKIRASVLALEAGSTLWVQQEQCRRIAREHDLTLHGWTPPGRGFLRWLLA